MILSPLVAFHFELCHRAEEYDILVEGASVGRASSAVKTTVQGTFTICYGRPMRS